MHALNSVYDRKNSLIPNSCDRQARLECNLLKLSAPPISSLRCFVAKAGWIYCSLYCKFYLVGLNPRQMPGGNFQITLSRRRLERSTERELLPSCASSTTSGHTYPVRPFFQSSDRHAHSSQRLTLSITTDHLPVSLLTYPQQYLYSARLTITTMNWCGNFDFYTDMCVVLGCYWTFSSSQSSHSNMYCS